MVTYWRVIILLPQIYNLVVAVLKNYVVHPYMSIHSDVYEFVDSIFSFDYMSEWKIGLFSLHFNCMLLPLNKGEPIRCSQPRIKLKRVTW